MKLSEPARNALLALVPDAANRFAPYFLMVGWQWTVRDHVTVAAYVPTVDDIAQTLRDLIEACSIHGDAEVGYRGKCSTGGLDVWQEGTELGISFVDDMTTGCP